jgi:hypothetical protein
LQDCPANWQPGDKSQVVSPELVRTYFSAVKKPNHVDKVKDLLRRILLYFLNNVLEIERKYKASLQTHPILTKSLTSAVIGALGEIIGGWMKARRDGKQTPGSILRSVNIKRVIIFASYGGIITGMLG